MGAFALGPRLAAIAAMVPPGRVVADIGTDHALLPIHLVGEQICQRAIGVEIAPGPLDAARRAVAASGLGERIDVRTGDGLAPLVPGEATVLVLAGMGGETMTKILAARPDVLGGVERLVLQPLSPVPIRRWLNLNGWVAVEEQLVLEAGRLYQVFAAERGRSRPLTPLELEVGPLLLEQGHPLLRDYLAGLAQKDANILVQMARSRRPLVRRQGIAEHLRAVRAVIKQIDDQGGA